MGSVLAVREVVMATDETRKKVSLQLRVVLVTYRAERRRIGGVPPWELLDRCAAILDSMADEVHGDATLEQEFDAVRREVLGGTA